MMLALLFDSQCMLNMGREIPMDPQIFQSFNDSVHVD